MLGADPFNGEIVSTFTLMMMSARTKRKKYQNNLIRETKRVFSDSIKKNTTCCGDVVNVVGGHDKHTDTHYLDIRCLQCGRFVRLEEIKV